MGVDGPTPFQSKGLRRGEWERNGKGGGGRKAERGGSDKGRQRGKRERKEEC